MHLQLKCQLGLGPGGLHLHVVSRLLDLEVALVELDLGVVHELARHPLLLGQRGLDQRVPVTLRLPDPDQSAVSAGLSTNHSSPGVPEHLGGARLAHALHVVLVILDLPQRVGDHLTANH